MSNDINDFSGLNAYMGHHGTQDAAQFSSPIDGTFELPPTTARLGESRAGALAILIKQLQRDHGWTFDQAVIVWLLTNCDPSGINWPPLTGA